MATPNHFDAAATANADRRRAILEAMAAGGMRGREEYERAQQAMTDTKKQALDSLLQGASRRNVPAAGVDELTRIASSAANRNEQQLASSRQSFEQNIGAMRQANTTYMDQASAAVPAIQAASDRELALYRAQQEAKAQQGAGDLPEWKLRGMAEGAATDLLDRTRSREEALYRAQSEANAGARIADRQHERGGGLSALESGMSAPDALVALNESELEAQRRAAIQAELRPLSAQRVDMETSPHRYQRQAAVEAGVDPTFATGIFREPTPQERLSEATTAQKLAGFGDVDPYARKANLRDEEANAVRESPAYRKAADTFEARLAEGTSDRNDFLRALEAAPFLKDDPTTKALLRAEYFDRFPGSKPSLAR